MFIDYSLELSFQGQRNPQKSKQNYFVIKTVNYVLLASQYTLLLEHIV